MPHDLLLLRHAKSDWDQSCDDFDRPLNPRGQRDAARIGHWLHAHAGLELTVLSSPARRAAQTAQTVCAAHGIAADALHWDSRIYLANLETLLDVLTERPASQQHVLLIGHNPGLEELLLHLAPAALKQRQGHKLLTTATLAWLELPGDWETARHGQATLRHFIRARDLAET
ncbi:MAG: histidine phosphatase family protein [Gammaproteobacteria bacterium]